MARPCMLQLNGSKANTTKEWEDFKLWLRSEQGIVTQVQILVVLSILLFAVQVIFGWWRRCCRSALIKYPLWLAYTITPSVVIYTLGLMHSSPIKNDLFDQWSFALLVALGSTNSMTAFDLDDNKQYMRHFVRHSWYVVNYIPVLMASWQSNSLLAALYCLPLFTTTMNFGRVLSSKMASSFSDDRSLSLKEYMTYEHTMSDNYDPSTLSGYNYPVYWTVGTCLPVSDIWLCNEGILGGSDATWLKEVWLSSALFQLLRRRFFGVACPESKLQKTHDLVFNGLLLNVEEDHGKAYRVIEVELAFAYDHFFTSSASFKSVLGYFTTVESISKVVCYFATIIEFVRDKDAIITAVIMAALVALEILQLYAYYSSDWGRILCVGWSLSFPRTLFSRLCLVLYKLPRLFGYWANNIGQLSVLADLHRRSFTADMMGSLSTFLLLGFVDYRATSFSRGIRNPGIKGPNYILLTDDVKLAIARTLKASDGRLSDGASSLRQNDQNELLWACKQENHASTMLIWHVATEYCEIAQACQAVEHESLFNRTIARKLSRYCAYLMASVPELLPDHHLDTTSYFHKVRREALHFLREERSLQSKYIKMRNFNQQQSVDESIFKKGIRLGRKLEEITDNSRRWKIMADLWTEMILYIAPSDNAKAHMRHLANGGEFLTHLWALLSHAGVLERDAQNLDIENTGINQAHQEYDEGPERSQPRAENAHNYVSCHEIEEDSTSHDNDRNTNQEVNSRPHVRENAGCEALPAQGDYNCESSTSTDPLKQTSNNPQLVPMLSSGSIILPSGRKLVVDPLPPRWISRATEVLFLTCSWNVFNSAAPRVLLLPESLLGGFALQAPPPPNVQDGLPLLRSSTCAAGNCSKWTSCRCS